ncbi:cysteine peptidase family C39 domain-containing protein [Ruminococcus bromii]|uniref:cysteine peptidase family C39 domain-containing protein n=1 Tax=Ruminococcus bromii TaxID=40518 RepID=UPI0039F59780
MIRFKCILQNDETDCGLACLAAIFRKYGLKVTKQKFVILQVLTAKVPMHTD